MKRTNNQLTSQRESQSGERVTEDYIGGTDNVPLNSVTAKKLVKKLFGEDY